MTDLTYGNGKVLTQSFDQDYRLTSKNTSGLYQLGYGYTPRNNIDAITDALDSSKNQSFSYDVLARLTDASGQYGIQNYSFDAIGSRLTKTQDGVTESYTYSSTSHRLDSVGSTNLTYDAAGNTLTKGDLTFTYNQVGRLATASKTGMNASYVYNAQGQRVKKIIAISSSEGTTSITTLYHYDQGGQLIAETDGQGTLIKEYLYLNNRRIAMIQQGETYYIHTNHLDAPLALTDANGDVQWKGSYEPYGNVTVETDNVSQSLRFPGQYADEETGLYQNYFRDYDPEIGRYIQSDPIGLNGGINTYGYVGGNPVNKIDRLGLSATLVYPHDYTPRSRSTPNPAGRAARVPVFGWGVAVGMYAGHKTYNYFFPDSTIDLDSIEPLPVKSEYEDEWPFDYPKPTPMEGDAICEVKQDPFSFKEPEKPDCGELFRLTKAKLGFTRALILYVICKADEANLSG